MCRTGGSSPSRASAEGALWPSVTVHWVRTGSENPFHTRPAQSRIDRVLERVARRDDYGTLLARGDVVRDLADIDDPDAWRSRLRRRARADRLRIRSGTGRSAVWALLVDGDTEHRRAEGERYGNVLDDVVPIAVEHRHEPSVLVRDGDEVILRCDRCPALGYAEGVSKLYGGPLLDEQ